MLLEGLAKGRGHVQTLAGAAAGAAAYRNTRAVGVAFAPSIFR